MRAVRAHHARIGFYEQTPTVSQLGWHSRGYLPHFDGGELAPFITFRLHDALPGSVLVRWKEELKHEKPGEVEAVMRRRVEAYLDQGHGSCYFKEPEAARMVQSALLFHDQTKYRLAAWVVMPNHAHVLCSPWMGHSLAEIMHSLKSYTASEAIRCSVAEVDSGRKNTSIAIFAMRDISQTSSLISRIIR